MLIKNKSLGKLNDLIDPKNPLIFIAPEPMADGSARKHNIKMEPHHEANGTQRFKNKFDCHIAQQDVDTFFITLTTIHSGKINIIMFKIIIQIKVLITGFAAIC